MGTVISNVPRGRISKKSCVSMPYGHKEDTEHTKLRLIAVVGLAGIAPQFTCILSMRTE